MTMYETAKAEGIKEGKAEGIQEGMAKGKAEGIQEGRLETARAMSSEGFSPEQISRLTGLSLNKLKKAGILKR